MLVAQALFKLLSTDPAIVALVAQRIYPGKLPQDVGGNYHYPAIVFRKTTEDRKPTLNIADPADGIEDLLENQWWVFCVGLEPTYSVQAKLSELVRLRLHKFSGVVMDATVSPVEQINIQGIFAGTSRDAYDDKTQTFQVISAYDVWAGEQQPIGG